jgi:DNA-binding NarL/FixJ family response regulator
MDVRAQPAGPPENRNTGQNGDVGRADPGPEEAARRGRRVGRPSGRQQGPARSGARRTTLALSPEDTWDRVEPVAVLVVDGDAEGRNRLCHIVAKAKTLSLRASAGTMAEAVDAAMRTRPEVVLSELFLPDGDAVALNKRFGPLAPRPELIVVTRFRVRGARVASIAAGARTCLASTAPPDSVLCAVLAAAQGQAWDGVGTLGSPLDRISLLEARVLAGVASGATNDDIARQLGYSTHYIKDLLEAVRFRLGAKDRAHAAALAVSLRLIRPARDGRFVPAPRGESARA